MVVSVDVANSNFVDFEISLGETKTFSFEQYVQRPGCGYDVRYTVTLIEASQEGLAIYNEASEGASLFATLEANLLEFKPQLGSLGGKTYGIFIRGHVDVDPYVQEPFIATMGPVYVTVLSEEYEVPNTAPEMTEFESEIEVEAGSLQNITLGYPIDYQLDTFQLLYFNTSYTNSSEWFQITEFSLSDGL